MQIHLVVENVDLGYHAVQGYIDPARAVQECQRMNVEHNERAVKNLIKYSNYTAGDARSYMDKFIQYEITIVEVE